MNIGAGGLNWLDLIILLFAILSLGVGFSQGMVRQVLGLAALYIAAILGAQYYAMLGNFIRSILFVPTNRFLNAIAFYLIVVFVWMLVTWLAFDAYKSTKIKLFPLIDYLGGAILGLFTMIIAATFLLPVLVFSAGEPWPGNETLHTVVNSAIQTSRMVIVFDGFKPFLLNMLLPWLPLGLPSIFNL